MTEGTDEEITAGVRDHEIHSRDREAVRERAGVDLTKDGAGLLGLIPQLAPNDDRCHFHMFANSLDVRDRWLIACANWQCADGTRVPPELVAVWKRAATPHQIWLLNWQTRCEITLATARKVASGQ